MVTQRQPMLPDKPKGIALILAAAVLWGTTGTAQSFAPLTLSSYWVGAARLLLSAVFFLFWIMLSDARSQTIHMLRRLPWRAVFCAAIGMTVYNLAFFAGVRETSVAIGTAVALGSGPVWAGLLQAVLLRQAPRLVWWVAVVVSVFGLVIATLGEQKLGQIGYFGFGLCLLSGLSYAVYAIATKQLVAVASPGVATAVVFTLAATVALPAALLLAGPPDINPPDVIVLLWLGVIATGVAYLLFSMGLQKVSSETGVALALAEPVAAVVLAVLIVGERPTLVSLLGLSLVFLGLCLLVRSEWRLSQ